MQGLIVDNFAGGGGASTGIEAALGRPVDVAINHDAEAVAMHAANHPATRHFCQSIMAIDPQDAVAGPDGRPRKVRLAWFSPDCKHHSKAKGGKPREKNIRDLAWVVVHWPERLGENAPDVIALENVEEFRKWGPLDEHGMPIKERQGEEFDLWVRRLKRCGYKVEWRELRACDHGSPTSRKRLYLIARRDGVKPAWPVPSHGKPGSPEVESGKLLPWRTAAECIDWSLPCPSIFERARPLKPATLRRIAHGTMRYVVNAARPFIVPVTNTGWNPDRIVDADRPMPTITTAKGGEMAVVDAGIVPLTHQGSPGRGQGTDTPFPTITSANRGELALASATLVATDFVNTRAARCFSVEDPLRTITAQNASGVAVAHLEKFHSQSTGRDPTDPLATVSAGGQHHAAVTAFLEKFSENSRGRPLDEPLHAVMAGAPRHAVVTAHVEQANGGPRNGNLAGRPVTLPFSTVTATGSQQRLVQTTLLPEGALPPEQMARANRVAAFLIKYYGSGDGQSQPLDRPLDTITTLARFAVVTVTIDHATYVIVDIGMRMLTPRELARAQGFPDSYVLDPIGPNGKPLSKSAQIRMIGNSVCPAVAEAMVRANLPTECFDSFKDVEAA